MTIFLRFYISEYMANFLADIGNFIVDYAISFV